MPATVGDGGVDPLVVAARSQDVLRVLTPALLSPDEQRRCSAMRWPEDRAAAHLLVRWIAAQSTGRAVESFELVQNCPACGSTEHGRPSFRGSPALHVSLAYTQGAVVGGVGRSPIGVDIEARSSRVDLGDAALGLVLTGPEIERVRSAPDPARSFRRHWTVKECLVKLGVTTLDTIATLDVALDDHTGSHLRTTGGGELHVIDWLDEELDAIIAAAGSARPDAVSLHPRLTSFLDERLPLVAVGPEP